MPFPNNFIKGIPNKTYLTSDGSVGAHLFHFDFEKFNRADGWCEQSINWEDDEHAIEFTLSQMKDNHIHFQEGVVTVALFEVDRINLLQNVNGSLSYERRQLSDNKYHGNLLLSSDINKAKMKMIAACIALAASKVIAQKST